MKHLVRSTVERVGQLDTEAIKQIGDKGGRTHLSTSDYMKELKSLLCISTRQLKRKTGREGGVCTDEIVKIKLKKPF